MTTAVTNDQVKCLDNGELITTPNIIDTFYIRHKATSTEVQFWSVAPTTEGITFLLEGFFIDKY
jgi:hypothetical protein